jgi:ATP-binding cassette subfamily B (MDR/TAP) protein 1
MEKTAREEVPLGRKDTSRSLASEILEQKRKASEDDKGKGDLSLPYLFLRMGKLNREGWWNYFFGTIYAISTYFLLSSSTSAP